MQDGGVILINTKQSPDRFSFKGDFRVLTVDASAIAMEEMGTSIANTAMLGAFAAVNDLIGIEPILKAVDKGMPGALKERNKKAIERTYGVVRGGK